MAILKICCHRPDTGSADPSPPPPNGQNIIDGAFGNIRLKITIKTSTFRPGQSFS